MESEFLLVWVPTALLQLAYPQPLLLLLKARRAVLGVYKQGDRVYYVDHADSAWERGQWVRT